MPHNGKKQKQNIRKSNMRGKMEQMKSLILQSKTMGVQTKCTHSRRMMLMLVAATEFI